MQALGQSGGQQQLHRGRMDLHPGRQVHWIARGGGRKPPQGAGEQRLERRPWDPTNGRIVRAAPLPLHQRRRDIVAVELAAAAIAERGRHGMPVGIEDAAGQRRPRHPVPPCRTPLPVRGELGLHGLEELRVDDRRMHARETLAPCTIIPR